MRQRRWAERGHFAARVATQHRSRRDTERLQRRLLLWGSAAVVVVLLVLLGGGFYFNTFKPPR